MTKSATVSLADHATQFEAEFAAIEDQLAHACAELAKLMNSYRLNVGALADAQGHALSATAALRKVATGIPGTAKPATTTRPQHHRASLADQLDDHRVAVTQTLALVQLLPGIDRTMIRHRSSAMASMLQDTAFTARRHQPTKERQ